MFLGLAWQSYIYVIDTFSKDTYYRLNNRKIHLYDGAALKKSVEKLRVSVALVIVVHNFKVSYQPR